MKRANLFILAALLPISPVMAEPAPAQRINFPEVTGMIDVTKAPYLADNTGRKDATAALSRAMLDAGRRTPGVFTTTDRAVQIVYLPKGIYRISDTLCFEDASIRARRKELMRNLAPPRNYIEGNMMLVGEGRDETTIRLEDHSARFQSGSVPMVQMSIKESNNQAYFNTVRDLTLDTGKDNPGATALRFVSSNLGAVRNVSIRCKDAQHPSAVGLDLTTRLGGLGYIRDVSVDGFATGILVGSYHPGYTFENITLSHQTEVGMDCSDKCVQILNLRSTNQIVALRNRTPAGQVVLLNSLLTGGTRATPAIENEGSLLVRNVDVQGYGDAIKNQDQVVPTGHIAEFLSPGQAVKLWPDAPATSLSMEIRDTPAMLREGEERWTVFDPSLHADNTAALQSLIDSGAEAILIRGDKGLLRLTDTIKIRGNLRRLHGGWCNMSLDNPARDGRPLFEIFTGKQPVVQIEAFSSGQREYDFTDVVNHSDRTVVLKDMFFGYGSSTYRNTGTGDLFLESVVSGGGDFDKTGMRKQADWLIHDQKVWARDWDPENYTPGILIDHTQAWCFGAKIGEIWGPYLELRNGSRMEMLGCVLNALYNPAKNENGEDRARIAIEVSDSDLCFVGVDRLRDQAGEGPNSTEIVETEKGETRKLPHESLPRRWPGSSANLSVLIPLYRSKGD